MNQKRNEKKNYFINLYSLLMPVSLFMFLAYALFILLPLYSLALTFTANLEYGIRKSFPASASTSVFGQAKLGKFAFAI